MKLHTPLAIARNDAFLIRLHSPLVTLAGGRVVEINPPKIQHKSTEWKRYFEIMASSEYEDIIYTIIDKCFLDAVSRIFLQQKLFEREENILEVIESLIRQKKIRVLKLKGTDHYISETNFNHLVGTIEKYISDFHNKHSHLPGVNHQELISGAGYSWLQLEIFNEAIKKLLD